MSTVRPASTPALNIGPNAPAPPVEGTAAEVSPTSSGIDPASPLAGERPGDCASWTRVTDRRRAGIDTLPFELRRQIYENPGSGNAGNIQLVDRDAHAIVASSGVLQAHLRAEIREARVVARRLFDVASPRTEWAECRPDVEAMNATQVGLLAEYAANVLRRDTGPDAEARRPTTRALARTLIATGHMSPAAVARMTKLVDGVRTEASPEPLDPAPPAARASLPQRLVNRLRLLQARLRDGSR